jgi:hypothetical protein
VSVPFMTNVLPLLAWNVPLLVVFPLGAMFSALRTVAAQNPLQITARSLSRALG